MLPPVRLINLGLSDWRLTQSAYHAVAELMQADSPDTVIITRPRQAYLCIGYHQDCDTVLDRDACASRNLPILRRRVGGGATYLDAQQLFYQCVFHHTRLPPSVQQVYARLLAAPLATLRAMGLNAELREDNEIEVNRRRIAGIGGGRIGGAVVVVGNLLFDFDYSALPEVWNAPSDAFRQLARAALREQVTTLRRELATPPSIEPVSRRLIAEFASTLGRSLVAGELSAVERQRAEALNAALMDEDWLALHGGDGQPMSALKISHSVFVHEERLAVGREHIRAAFCVRDEHIEQVILESEPPRDWTALEHALRGLPFRQWSEVVACASGWPSTPSLSPG